MSGGGEPWGRRREEASSPEVKVQQVIKRQNSPGEQERTGVGHDADRKLHVEREEGEVVTKQEVAVQLSDF